MSNIQSSLSMSNIHSNVSILSMSNRQRGDANLSHTIASVESFKLIVFKQHLCHGLLYGLEVEEWLCDDQCCIVEVHLCR